MEEIMLKIENVSKQYKLGQIGGTSLRDELQRRRAKRRGEEDPTRQIGAKDYKIGETFMALDDINIEVRKGERVGIIGHNGAGKSTLLKLISRVTAPTSGQICMNGRVASMLEVGTGFHPELTGRENIYMNGAILGMTKAEIDSKMEDIIEFSECRRFIDTPVKRYSSGMYVKLAFSVAAHLDSEIMIMDEVLAVGDMAFQKKCLTKMSDVSKTQGRTILYVSHNMNTIRQLCERCVVLDHGKVVFDGDVEDAIGIYMDINADTRISYVYGDSDRDGDDRLSLQMLGLDILDRKSNQIIRGETLNFTLHCRANQDVKEINVRFEVFFSDGSIVGTAFSDKTINASRGEKVDVDFSLSTSNFAPGYYNCVGLLFEVDHSGNQSPIDRVQTALSFEIVEKNDDIVWLHRWWGHVHLDDVRVKDVRITK